MTTGSDSVFPQFDDGKAPDALRTIGEVASALGIRQHVLRYWEEQFPMLNPVKRSGGRRYYRPEDIALIASIDRLVHREGYTLRGACKALANNHDETPSQPAAQAQVARLVEPSPAAPPAQLYMFGGDASGIVSELRSIRGDLAAALALA